MVQFVEIADPDDPRVAAFRGIRERDLVRGGAFVAEGTVVVGQLAASPFFVPKQLLVLRNRLNGIADLLDHLPDDMPVFVAERPVIDAVAGFAMHRGVLAVGEARAVPRLPLPERLAALAAEGRTVVAAVGIANHDNIGGIFRNAAAFAAGMVLVDETSCDPLYRKAIRVSAGAVLSVPFERVRAERLPDLLREAGFRAVALSPGGTLDLAALDAVREPVALVLGAEGPGLPPSLMARMETLRIDMAPGFDSLNVATSAAIALQRLYSARGGASEG
ncbi:TrmH family RNA methyltransferase [Aureimonas leprariae]|uniref:RNA methyltransferase n=1 Tax=Plantimonas leprariae TaxID=2615207 RepID=A0A7V7PSJ8_9HYPH|nr:RNA methyltransferase [Aureimonas leprariae]KAB0682524.1 RNA methyltransferase [Aureimonas leprariae]